MKTVEIENVWRITQWGYGEGAEKIPLYVFSVPAKTLVGESDIYRRKPDRRDGYQRDLTPIRLGKGKMGVTGYLLNQMGIFPTSILVNVRKEDATVEFQEKERLNDYLTIGKLLVPDNVVWFVIDGQHRLEGLKAAIREVEELNDFPVLLTMTNEELFYEMLIFYMVNSRAKSVPTDLAYRILQKMMYDQKAPAWIEKVIMTGANRRKAIAATIVDFLNWKEKSPFYGKIREVGEPRKTEHLTTDGMMTRYVSFILRSEIFENMFDEDVADLLISYWRAIQETYTDAFDHPENYVLLTSLGLSSLSRVFSVIYGYCARDQDVSERNMKKYLSYLLEKTPEHRDVDFRGPITIKWWHKVDGPGLIRGGGEGLFKNISRNFAEKISLVSRARD